VRVAIDSSVLVAAHISRDGVCAELLEHVLLDDELVVFDFILRELARKLLQKFGFAQEDVDRIGGFLRRAAMVVAPANLPIEICRDPEDVPVLGTAVAGECALLVSVDRDLLDMHSVQGIPIVRPGEYWRRVREAK